MGNKMPIRSGLTPPSETAPVSPALGSQARIHEYVGCVYVCLCVVRRVCVRMLACVPTRLPAHLPHPPLLPPTTRLPPPAHLFVCACTPFYHRRHARRYHIFSRPHILDYTCQNRKALAQILGRWCTPTGFRQDQHQCALHPEVPMLAACGAAPVADHLFTKLCTAPRRASGSVSLHASVVGRLREQAYVLRT